MLKPEGERLIIAGPCAAESRKQVLTSAYKVKELGLDGLRACLWKPRTSPGFEGVGEAGIPWLLEAARLGLIVATEVMLPEDVENLVKNLDGQPETKVLIWLGARNQNHRLQKEIAALAKGDPHLWLMIKNPPWPDKRHWLGVHDHVLAAGFPAEKIIHCHRGFYPNENNHNNYRNHPDFEMVMQIKEATGRPMIIDPSHIGGSPENIRQVIVDSLKYPIDGFLIETHPQPTLAQTDVHQQLTFDQLEDLLKIFMA